MPNTQAPQLKFVPVDKLLNHDLAAMRAAVSERTRGLCISAIQTIPTGRPSVRLPYGRLLDRCPTR